MSLPREFDRHAARPSPEHGQQRRSKVATEYANAPDHSPGRLRVPGVSRWSRHRCVAGGGEAEGRELVIADEGRDVRDLVVRDGDDAEGKAFVGAGGF